MNSGAEKRPLAEKSAVAQQSLKASGTPATLRGGSDIEREGERMRGAVKAGMSCC